MEILLQMQHGMRCESSCKNNFNHLSVQEIGNKDNNNPTAFVNDFYQEFLYNTHICTDRFVCLHFSHFLCEISYNPQIENSDQKLFLEMLFK